QARALIHAAGSSVRPWRACVIAFGWKVLAEVRRLSYKHHPQFSGKPVMASQGFRTSTVALLVCAATLVAQCAQAGSTDAVFISSGGSTSATEAAPYDSEYAAAAREIGS